MRLEGPKPQLEEDTRIQSTSFLSAGRQVGEGGDGSRFAPEGESNIQGRDWAWALPGLSLFRGGEPQTAAGARPSQEDS